MEKIFLEFKSVITYLIPGYIFLISLSFHLQAVHILLGAEKGVPDVPALLPIVILAVGGGVIINAFNLTLVRPILELTCVSRPDYDYSKLKESELDLFKRIVEENYRYYQAYSNMLTSGLVLLISWLFSTEDRNIVVGIVSIGILSVLFLAARTSLIRTYVSISRLMNKEKTMNDQDPHGPPKKPAKPVKPPR